MKANELRIGNWVYSGIDSKQPIKVPPIMIAQLSKNEDKEHNIKPIPITEDWLLRFGFELNNIRVKFWTEDRYPQWSLKVLKIKKNNVGDFMLDGFGFFLHIKHIHQLQNLYFALTGEELKLLKDE